MDLRALARRDALSVLADLATALTAAPDEQTVHELAVERLQQVMAVDRTSVSLMDGDALRIVARRGAASALVVDGLVIPQLAIRQLEGIRTGQLVNLDSTTLPGGEAINPRYGASAPIITVDGGIGMLNAGRGALRFDASEEALLIQMAAMVAANINRIRLTDQLHRVAAEAQAEAASLTMLHLLGSLLAAAVDRRAAFDAIRAQLPDVVGAERVSYEELGDNRLTVQMWGAAGAPRALGVGATRPVDGSLFDRVRSARSLLAASVDELETSDGAQLRSAGLHHLVAAPVWADGDPVGLLTIATRSSVPYTSLCRTVVTLAAQMLSGAIQRIRTNEENERNEAASATRLRQIIDLVPNLVFAKDSGGAFVLANQAMADAYGLAPDQVLGRTEIDLRGPTDEVIRARRVDRAVLAEQRTISSTDESFTTASGEHLLLHTTKIPFTVAGSSEPAVLGVSVDVTEWRRAELALERSESRFRALFDDNPAMLVTVDGRGRIVAANRFGSGQLGYRPGELTGRPFVQLHADRYHATVRRILSEAASGAPGQILRWESQLVRRDGETVWSRQTARVINDPDGTTQLLVVCEDVTDAHQLAERLQHQATHDQLTGLVNRAELDRRLAAAVESSREGARHVLGFLDLDHFKLVNDSCGHSAGDMLLRQLAGVLAAFVQPGQTLARFGGDEFVVLVEDAAVAEVISQVERLRRAVEELDFRWADRPFHVTASIGLVELDGRFENAAAALSGADAACFLAKDNGRNRVEIWQHDDHTVTSRKRELEWPGRMREALAEDRLVLVAQPLVAFDPRGPEHDRIAGYELLVRLREADGTLILPGAFLPAVERYNLATRLDRWVAGEAVRLLGERPEASNRIDLWTVNISGYTLADEDFFAFLAGRLRRWPALARRLCVEVTESAAARDPRQARRLIGSLRELGCRVALDDFGSGVSSLGYLRQLDVDVLKIFGSLVRSVPDDPLSEAMVRAVHQVARAAGLRTVAEFVETCAAREAMRNIGVDMGQGLALGAPELLTVVLDRLDSGEALTVEAMGRPMVGDCTN